MKPSQQEFDPEALGEVCRFGSEYEKDPGVKL